MLNRSNDFIVRLIHTGAFGWHSIEAINRVVFSTSLPFAIRGPQSAALPVFSAPEIPAE